MSIADFTEAECDVVHSCNPCTQMEDGEPQAPGQPGLDNET